MLESLPYPKDLFDVFIWQKVYQGYADEFLKPEQCDDSELQDIPGYVPPPGVDSKPDLEEAKQG